MGNAMTFRNLESDMKNWRLHLSSIIPMPFSSAYGRYNDAGKPCVAHHQWWQWRDRILSQKLTLLEIPAIPE